MSTLSNRVDKNSIIFKEIKIVKLWKKEQLK